VEIVGGITPGNNRLEHVEPPRDARIVFPFFLQNEVGNLVRIQFLASDKGAGRAASNLANDRSEMVANDDLAELFMAGLERMQIVVVKEVTEGAVADIVHEGGHTEELFDIIRRRDVLQRLLQEWIKMTCEPACHVHGPAR